ncbi:SufE family protein [Fulvivirgaceae bacterium LMO-SS25]
MQNSIVEREEELVQNFQFLENWDDKYQYVIEFGDKIPVLNDEKKTDDLLVRSCQSRLWLDHEFRNGKLLFFADCDSPFPKGLASLFIFLINNESPEDIIESEIKILERTKLIHHLSPIRYRGIVGFYNQLKSLTRPYLNK